MPPITSSVLTVFWLDVKALQRGRQQPVGDLAIESSVPVCGVNGQN